MNKKGFTLIEAILYIGFVAILLPVAAYFLFFVLQIQLKNESVLVVEQEGQKVMQLVTQMIRNADKINNPLLGDSTSTLSLTVFSGSSTSVVIINFVSNTIRLTDGTSTAVALNSSAVTPSGLLFSNTSRGGTPGSVKIQFTLVKDLYSKIFYESASLRSH